jgi:hypothetical protein
MSIQSFINDARVFYEEINDYFAMRPELVIALTNDAVSLDKVFELVPTFAAILDKYHLKDALQSDFRARVQNLARQPSSLRLLAQVFGHPWQHINLEQALAEAVAATRVSLGLDRACETPEECGDCECEEKGETPISVGITPEGNLAYTVSNEPLTFDEEVKFFGELFDKASGKPATVESEVTEQHDPVNRPSHYTNNASGVEAIELTEKMSFNLGNAFKYVFRRDGKGNSIQDVSKAEWYLKREIGRLEELLENTPAGFTIMMHPAMAIADLRKADRVIEVETNDNAADYYTYLFEQGVIQDPEDLVSLHAALESLRALIEDIKEGRAE